MSRPLTRRTVARRHLALVGLALLAASACGPGGEPRIELGPAVAAAPQGGVTQVVLDIANTGDGADRLVAVDTDAALGAEIHRTLVDGEPVMEPIPALEVPPGERIVFDPEQLHLMLIAPQHTVAPGATFDLVLEFERSGTMTVRVEVLGQTELRL